MKSMDIAKIKTITKSTQTLIYPEIDSIPVIIHIGDKHDCTSKDPLFRMV